MTTPVDPVAAPDAPVTAVTPPPAPVTWLECDSWIPVAVAELAKLDEPHREKKRATIIALVDAALAGSSEEMLWDRDRHPETCSRTIYHNKWKKDPTFAGVLQAVLKLAQTWQDTQELRALATAARRLRLASPDAADQLVSIATTGQVRRVFKSAAGVDEVLLAPAAAAEVLRATTAVLDRAGMETASKATTTVAMDADQFARLREEALQRAEQDHADAERAWEQQQQAAADG